MNTILLADLVNPNVVIQTVLPEMVLAVTAIFIMVYDSYVPGKHRVTATLSLIGLAASSFALYQLWSEPGVFASGFNGMVVTDGLRLSFTAVFILVAALTILISSVWIDNENVPAGEYHVLVLFATIGMMFMASGNDMVIIFLGVETLSIATYVMAGLRKTDLRSNESAMKYFVLGSYASAFLLYGMALIYGATGSTNITEIASSLDSASFPALLLVGGAMLLIGFGFKVAVVPFHVWTPDVYEGAPSPITGFMAAGPKAAAFASFLRVFVIGFPLVAGSVAAQYLHETWITALAIIAILTTTVGNLAAIVQNNVKRMLAYSSIAHAGYALVGFVGAGVATTIEGRNEAIAAVAFYMLTYSVANLGAFAVLTLLARKNDRRTEFEDYNGIGFKSPVLSFTLSLFMLSLLGLPLTAGFIGKVLVFRPALEAGQTLLTVMVVVAVINTAISAYYYLRLIVVMFFRERSTDWVVPKIPAAVGFALLVAVLGVFYFGLFGNSVIRSFTSVPAEAPVSASNR
ncbi:MAG: NADH-quinone oxidoreductase subunit N [Acidobacteriota bacterium]|nr:NADH-quinone oxidoreductase subunit N [Acidobacteriota bacterium]MDH3528814.1 NADH-quinone oxidoreductase subunit N [Acidobacteriota bacterium]